MEKQFRKPHCGSRNAAKAGGVGIQSPGPTAGSGVMTALKPSAARQARIWSATDLPQAIPLALLGPLGIVASIWACNASKLAALVGKSAISTWCAAALAAAFFEALALT